MLFEPLPPPEREADAMTTATWITMIGILTFVWGGFALALKTAIGKEGEKLRERAS